MIRLFSLFLVALISSSFTVAEAALGKRKSPKSKCERLLVPDDMVEKVTGIALEVGELHYQAVELGLEKAVAELNQFKQMIEAVRSYYTVSMILTTERLAELETAFNENRGRIQSEINTARFPKVPVAQASQNEPPPLPDFEFGGFRPGWPPNSNEGP